MLKKGDLLLEKSGGGEGQPVGCVVLYNDSRPAICSNFIARVELSKGMCPSFWRYVHSAAYSVRLTTCSINQTSGIQNLDQAAYLNERVAYPPHDEQVLIANFLDGETSKINALIQEQERLVELLTEKRLSVISNAVTKGVNLAVPLKDSGVDWLGAVPAHWRVAPLRVAMEFISYGFTNPMPVDLEGPLMLTAADIGDGFVNWSGARSTTEFAYKNLLTDKSRPIKGDVLVTKDGTLGRVAIHDGRPACINQSVAVIRPNKNEVSSDYLSLCLRGGVFGDRMIFDAGGTTIKHIYITRLSKMPILLPPLGEQSQILARVNKEVSEIDELRIHARKFQELMTERRNSLITAAVTGKIDVRSFVASQH